MVIIPTFAMDRSAGILRVLNDFRDQGMKFDITFDTPLGQSMLFLYSNDYDESAWFKHTKGFPFRTKNVHMIGNYQEHLLALKNRGPGVFITSSGMGNGGRVTDYFKHHIQNDKAVFVFPGFLCENTPSRRLVEAEKGDIIEIAGERYKKRCETVWLHGFSSHGYIGEKIDLLDCYPNAKKVLLNHGEPESISDTLENISEYNQMYEHVERSVSVPSYDEVVRLY